MGVNLDELEAKAAAATRGPWTWTEYRYGPPTLEGRAGEPGVYEWDTEVLEAEHWGECGCRSACTLELSISDADKAYLAAVSPDIVQQLIDELREARAALAARA